MTAPAKRPLSVIMILSATALFLFSTGAFITSETGLLVTQSGETIVDVEHVNFWGTLGATVVAVLAIACAVALWRYWRGDLTNTKRILFSAGVLGLFPLFVPGAVALVAGALVNHEDAAR